MGFSQTHSVRTLVLVGLLATLSCSLVLYSSGGTQLHRNIRRGFQSLWSSREPDHGHEPSWRETLENSVCDVRRSMKGDSLRQCLEANGLVFRHLLAAKTSLIFDELIQNASCKPPHISENAPKAFQTWKTKNLNTSLEELLRKASMPDNTIIVTTLNQAWAQPNTMIDLFLESFHVGDKISHLLNHLVVIALDQVAYNRCEELHSLCYMLKTEGVDFSGEKFFMTEDYLKMMWRRIDFLRIILEMGYSFVFSDADIMWFRDPFPQFDKSADFQIACDQYTGASEDLNNQPNGGFLYVRSNNRTINFYKYWYMSREDHPGLHDQDVLNQIKSDQDFMDIGLELRFLNTLHFGGFCQVSKDFDQVCTMHANCCTGLQRKLQDLRLVMADWKRYKLLSTQMKHHQRIYWRAPRQCLPSFGGFSEV